MPRIPDDDIFKILVTTLIKEKFIVVQPNMLQYSYLYIAPHT